MRDCTKQADIGARLIRRNPRSDIGLAEFAQLQEIYNDRGNFEAFTTAFLFGFAVGSRAEKKNRTQRKKKEGLRNVT